jgi:hypothetical protein
MVAIGSGVACGERGEAPAAGAGAAGDSGRGNSRGPSVGGGQPAIGAPGGTGGGGGGSGGDATSVADLQYDGSVALALSSVVVQRQIAISAPIVPRTSAIYKPFPATLEGEQQMAHEAALVFEWLLVQCAPLYPTITLDPGTGAGLTPEQLAVNYAQVGNCAYEQYSGKPYWIPKLVDDVDICGTELGAGWRLITEADLASMRESDFQALADKWQPRTTAGASGLGFFFSTLRIWVRAADGTIQSGTLAPGVTGSRVAPLVFQNGFTATNHYEGELGLRCIRESESQ